MAASDKQPTLEALTSVRPWQIRLARRSMAAGLLLNCLLLFLLVAALYSYLDEHLAGARFHGIGAGLTLGILLLMRMVRDRWIKRGVAELREQFGDRDPGPSPVPWISTPIWQGLQRWDIQFELLYGFAELEPCVEEWELCFVDAQRRLVAPVVAPLAGLPVADAGPSQVQVDQLNAPPRARGLQIWGPEWPVCCERLATLVGLELCYEPLYWDAFGRGNVISEDEALYHCRACGRIYLGQIDVI